MELAEADRAVLEGAHGKAAQVAVQIVLRMAALQGADRLINVSQAHIGGCIYTGPGSLKLAQQLRDWGGKVSVPTTLNSISIHHRCWRAQGIDPAFGEPASQLGDAYVDMGARPTSTCTPYLLDTAPSRGEQIV
jgi:predicted aconitase